MSRSHFPSTLDPRRTIVVAHIDDVLANPDLVAALAQRYRSDRRVLLAIGAPGWSEERLGAALEPVAAAAGLHEEGSLDVLALPLDGKPALAALARASAAMLVPEGPREAEPGVRYISASGLDAVGDLADEIAAACAATVTRPRVSLALPSYMQGPYLARAIRSVLTQDLTEWELLVHDAESSDETREILVEAAALDPRVKVVVERDGGQSDAINRAFARASGDVLGWLNADDELEPGALRRAVAALDSSDCGVVYGRGFYVDENDEFIRPFNVLPFDRELLKTTDYILQPAAFWRASLWRQVGPLDTRLHYAFDWEWFARASRQTDFLFLDRDLARYRLTGDNKSLVGEAKRERELAKVARRNGGVRQPTFLYWNARRLGRRWKAADRYADRLWAENHLRICT